MPLPSRALFACLAALAPWAAAAAADTPPVPLRQAQPIYPREMKIQGISGIAIVSFFVETDGRVRRAHATAYTHSEFGPRAEDAILQWRFRPATHDGKPVIRLLSVPIEFSLNGPDPLGGVDLSRLEYATERVFELIVKQEAGRSADDEAIGSVPRVWFALTVRHDRLQIAASADSISKDEQAQMKSILEQAFAASPPTPDFLGYVRSFGGIQVSAPALSALQASLAKK